MPLPEPRGDESKKDFISRCMSAEASSFPDSDQRFAICNSQWDERSGSKVLTDILGDPEFWEEFRTIMVGRVMPMFREAFLVGAEIGSNQRPVADPDDTILKTVRASLGLKQDDEDQPPPVGGAGGPLRMLPFDFEAAVLASDELLAVYMDSWWAQFSASTQRGLRSAIERSLAQGLGIEAVIADIEPLFGAARAEVIAVTETTRLLGQGAQQTYKQSGFTQWEWRTVRDALVDPICQELAGQHFPMSRTFEPAHPNCRCWPVPFGKPVARTLSAA